MKGPKKDLSTNTDDFFTPLQKGLANILKPVAIENIAMKR